MANIEFVRANINYSDEDKTMLWNYVTEHIAEHGELPYDFVINADPHGANILSQSQILSAFTDKQIAQLENELTVIEKAKAGGYFVGTHDAVTSSNVGKFVDSIAGQDRKPSDVAGRLLEEVVELCMATGLSHGDIMMHVADAMHNQALKDSRAQERTVFPSGHVSEYSQIDVCEEVADVGLVLKDLAHVAKVDQRNEETTKWNKFIRKTFRVSDKGTLYAVKPHVNYPHQIKYLE